MRQMIMIISYKSYFCINSSQAMQEYRLKTSLISWRKIISLATYMQCNWNVNTDSMKHSPLDGV